MIVLAEENVPTKNFKIGTEGIYTTNLFKSPLDLNFIFVTPKKKEIVKDIEKRKDISDAKNDAVKQELMCECGNKGGWLDDPHTGDRICPKCGMVLDEKQIDSGKDWRSFSCEEEDTRSRAGPKRNLYIYDGGLSTSMRKNECKDSRGNTLSSSEKQKNDRLSKMHSRYVSKDRKPKNYSEAMDQLKTYSQSFYLNKNIKDQVAYQYLKILDSQKLKGRKISNILLGLIYLICQKNHEPLTITEIVDKGNITEKEFNRFKKKVIQSLGAKLSPITPFDYLNRINGRLQVQDNQIVFYANILLNRVKAIDNSIVIGKDPAGVAGGAYYLSCCLLKSNFTQQQIGETVSVTDVTIRTRYTQIINTNFTGNNLVEKVRCIVNQ